jgi:hypothetical protein
VEELAESNELPRFCSCVREAMSDVGNSGVFQSDNQSDTILESSSISSFALLELIVDDASASMLDPIVADHKVTRRSGFVHASHIPSV